MRTVPDSVMRAHAQMISTRSKAYYDATL